MSAFLLVLSLPLSGCGIACEADSERYAGEQEVAPGLTAAQALASADHAFEKELQWVPFPAQNEVSHYGTSVPELPFSGRVTLTVEVVRLDDAFIDHYSYQFDEGCSLNGSPSARARLVLQTDDGALDEDVPASISPYPGGSIVRADITNPSGTIAEFFADAFEEPDFATLQVEVKHNRAVDVHLLVTRPDEHGAHFNNLKLL